MKTEFRLTRPETTPRLKPRRGFPFNNFLFRSLTRAVIKEQPQSLFPYLAVASLFLYKSRSPLHVLWSL